MSGALDAGGAAGMESKTNFLVVGLGGSAGSITSFREFFRHVPQDSGMAYVVILHLAPEQESRLAEVLQTVARIPVMQVREAIRVEPDHVYVIPPNKSMEMQDGSLTLSNLATFEERRAPIDIFFRTLADTHDSRAVCIVMSGSGSDGSMGLRRVKEYNGLVLVQDPSEAAFGEMPRNCIATGLVDYVVPVSEMPGRISDYQKQIRSLHIADDSAERAADEEQALMEVFTVLRLRTGHDFTNYKRATLLRRIERRMAVRDLQRLAEYVALLRDRHDEAHALLRELLISVTNFFRDADVWEKVSREVIPRLLADKRGDDPLRIWIPGCATGEEAYSVAMLLAEHNAVNVQIFATDLDEHAIARARNGCYSETDVADVGPERLRVFFLKEPDGYRVSREIREMVLFAHHNVIKDPPFSHLHFVSCRNLLIYLNRAAQQRVLEVLHFALEPGGYLLLGTAEAVDGTPGLFSLVDKEAHLYQSRAVERVLKPGGPPPYSRAPAEARAVIPPAADAERVAETRPRERFAPIDLHQRLLEQYAPPSLIVDEQHNIVHLTERAGRYLQFAGGEASINLLHVVRQELRIDLRSALFQAAQKRIPVVARGLDVHFPGERDETIDIIVRPVPSDGDSTRRFFLVLFEEARERAEPPGEATAVEPAARQLEEELIRVRTQMRATIEQYEIQAEEAKAANEELQAMNEELRSTAEELETSQEELQSVNEELQTVNQELKVKIDEITHAGDDLRNLISSTDIGTIFVDRSLRVKLFTPRAREIFNLIPADVGRPLSDITNKLVIDGLVGEMGRVLERLQAIEREVQTRDDSWYLMRLLPYRTSDDRIDGVVLTLLDVTERHKAEEALRESEARLASDLAGMRRLYELHARLANESDVRNALDAILDVATEFAGADSGTVQLRTDDGERLEIVAQRGFRDDSPFIEQIHSEQGHAVPVDRKRLVIADTAGFGPLEGTAAGKAANAEGIRALIATPLIGRSGETFGFLSVHYRQPHQPSDHELRRLDLLAWTAANFIERHRADSAVRRAEERYRALFVSMDQGYAVVEGIAGQNGAWEDFRFLEVNPAYAKQTGMSDVVGRTATEALGTPNPRWAEVYGRVASTGQPVRFEESEPALRRLFDLYAFRLGGAGSRRVAVLFNDITQRKRDEAALQESETRLQTIADIVPDLLWMSDPNGERTWYNDRWLAYTGQSEAQAIGLGWSDVVHPDDREQWFGNFKRAAAEGRSLQHEHRIRSSMGEYRWFLVNAAPLRDERGEVVRYYGAATDIQEQRVAREQLEERVRERTQALLDLSLSRQQLLERLVTATEEERQRIARELHDEMGQHITALRVGLESLQPRSERIDDLKAIIGRIDRSIDRLTLELRPPALDQLGLHGAITSLAAEFSKASGVRVALHLGVRDGDRFAQGVESALYRVLQESLTNVWKHASAATVSVILERERDSLRMIIEDNGGGFDAAGAIDRVATRGRFGLLGMRERLALVRGTLDIESQPGSGTTIYVRVPLTPG